MKEPDFYFRLVGFKEVWALLDLSRYDEILKESFRRMEEAGKHRHSNRTNERIQEGKVEIFQRNTWTIQSTSQNPSGKLIPISEDSRNKGKSLGIMPVRDAEQKFL